MICRALSRHSAVGTAAFIPHCVAECASALQCIGLLTNIGNFAEKPCFATLGFIWHIVVLLLGPQTHLRFLLMVLARS